MKTSSSTWRAELGDALTDLADTSALRARGGAPREPEFRLEGPQVANQTAEKDIFGTFFCGCHKKNIEKPWIFLIWIENIFWDIHFFLQFAFFSWKSRLRNLRMSYQWGSSTELSVFETNSLGWPPAHVKQI